MSLKFLMKTIYGTYIILLLFLDCDLFLGAFIGYNIIPESPPPIFEKLIVYFYLVVSIFYLLYALILVIKGSFNIGIIFCLFAFSPTIINVVWKFLYIVREDLALKDELVTAFLEMDFASWFIFMSSLFSIFLLYTQREDIRGSYQ